MVSFLLYRGVARRSIPFDLETELDPEYDSLMNCCVIVG